MTAAVVDRALPGGSTAALCDALIVTRASVYAIAPVAMAYPRPRSPRALSAQDGPALHRRADTGSPRNALPDVFDTVTASNAHGGFRYCGYQAV